MMNLSIESLKEQSRWVLWKLQTVEEKQTKVPYQPNGYKADVTNPKHLHTYAELETHASKFSGIGLALGEFDGVYVWGVDFDKCCDAYTHKFTPETRQVVIDLDSYGEYSPSGIGAHVLGVTTKPLPVEPGKKAAGVIRPYPGCKQIEVKGLGYYFTFSNNYLSKTPPELLDRTEQIHALYARVANIKTEKQDTGIVVTMSVSEEERFKMLMGGDMSLYNEDHSTADFALCILLAKKYNCNAFKIDDAFRKSRLYREKWERDDYRENTITRAVKTVAKDTPFLVTNDDDLSADSPEEYIVDPTGEEGVAGWGPIGEVNLVGGASGIGKTSLLMHVAELIREGRPVCGHPTKMREYRFLSYDRSVRGFKRTATALHMPEVIDRVSRVTSDERRAPMGETLDKYAELYPQVGLWIIEGMDLACKKASDMDEVSTLLESVERVAGRRRVGVIGTVGSAKHKENEGYVQSRDKLFGSVAWARRSETVIYVDLYDANIKNGARSWTVLPRDGREEQFFFEFKGGLRECAEPEAKPVNEVFDAITNAVFTKFKPGEAVTYCGAFGVKSTFYNWRKAALMTGQLVASGKDVLVPFVAAGTCCPLCKK